VSDQNPPTAPNSGGEPPAGGGWPPASPAPDWQAMPTTRADSPGWPTPPGQTPGTTPQGHTPPPAPSPWQAPPGYGQPGYGQPSPGTPPPGGYPPPGTPAPGGYPQPAPGTPAPGQSTPYPGGYTDPQQAYQQPGYQQTGYQQTDYGQQGYQQQPGYPAPTGPNWPGQQPPQKSNRNAVILISALAAVAAIVLGIVIALAVHGGGGSKPVAGSTVSQGPATASAPAGGGQPSVPAVSHTTAPPGCTPLQAPAGAPDAGVYQLGQTATVRGDGDTDISTYTARITLNSICSQTTPVETYGDPPKNGTFVVANFTVEMVTGSANVYPLSFFAQTADGSRYESTYDTVGSRLDADDLAAGQKVTGNIVFDVPADNHLIYWEPLFATSKANFRY